MLEPSDWTVHIEAQSRDGQPIVIDAKLDDIGSYNRTLTGTWKQAGVDHADSRWRASDASECAFA